MNADIVKQMRSEEADLLRKLKAVRDFLAAYVEAPNDTFADAQPIRVKTSNGSREKVDITSFTEQTRRSVLLSLEAMVRDSGLKKTKELVDYIEKHGHEVSGKNKVNSLGALLARSVDVEGRGKSGWTVANRDQALQILQKYAPKEKEPSSDEAVGSDAGTQGAPTPRVPFRLPQISPAS